jgi:hypothetical protein
MDSSILVGAFEPGAGFRSQPTKPQPHLSMSPCTAGSSNLHVFPRSCILVSIHPLTFINPILPHNCDSVDLPQCTQSDLWREQCRLLLLGMFFKAPVGTTPSRNLSKEITCTIPTFLRPRLLHVRTLASTSKLLNGSLYCTSHIQTLRLTLPPRALIKKASNFEDATVNLQREVNIYGLPGVASAVCFRKMYEKIDDSTIALEWLDTTLAEVKYRPDMRTYSIIKAVLNAALTSCVILEDHKYVNTGRIPGLNELAFANYSRL